MPILLDLAGDVPAARTLTAHGIRHTVRRDGPLVAAADHEGAEMPEPEPKRAIHNAGAFLTPDGIGGPFPVPMGTLSDEYHDEPAEPEEDHEPEPEAPGIVRKAIDRLTHRDDPSR
jgi:hypothetical protein